jgi:hypothetical protein
MNGEALRLVEDEQVLVFKEHLKLAGFGEHVAWSRRGKAHGNGRATLEL